MISLFTNSVEVQQFSMKVIVTVFIFFIQDFFQGVLCGTIKALGKQKPAAYINFVTYYILVIPSGYYFGFVHGSHEQFDEE